LCRGITQSGSSPNIEKLTFTGTETVRQSHSARVERQEVLKAVDEVEFRSEFKQRLMPQLIAWIDNRPSRQ
jgi:hypothetical protein